MILWQLCSTIWQWTMANRHLLSFKVTQHFTKSYNPSPAEASVVLSFNRASAFESTSTHAWPFLKEQKSKAQCKQPWNTEADSLEHTDRIVCGSVNMKRSDCFLCYQTAKEALQRLSAKKKKKGKWWKRKWTWRRWEGRSGKEKWAAEHEQCRVDGP